MERIFEISWEVCNKFGGIYTVISSKTDYIKRRVREYYFIGPYFRGKKNFGFEEKEIPKEFEETVEFLKTKKIFCHFGIWKKTKIKTFLIDFLEFMEEKNEIKRILWEEYKIDSLNSDFFWFDIPVVWSYAVGIFLESIYNEKKETVAHFHEWLSGAGILYLKSKNIKIGKIFTSHATVLGRAMARNKEIFKNKNPEEEARRLNVIEKHMLEKESALNSEIFTTVSKLTAEECEKIIGRRPEVIINGLDLKMMPNMEEIPEMHKKNKEKLKEITIANFFPHYYFNIENCLFYYISGRYELYTKGIDIYIKALGNLNRRLKEENSKREIVAFLLIPCDIKGVNQELLKNFLLLKDIKGKIEDFSEETKKRILLSFFSKNKNLIDERLSYESKKLIAHFDKREGPIVSTHLLKEKDNKIIELIKEAGLENKKEDKIKIIFYPVYLSEGDGFLNTDYYNIISGFNLGIFPSFYEPWGYTPFESASLGVPTITTNLSGFGRYVIKNKKERGGIIVINREEKNDDEIIKELEEEMHSYLNLNKIQRIKDKTIAQEFAHQISWENLVEEYFRCYEEAFQKVN